MLDCNMNESYALTLKPIQRLWEGRAAELLQLAPEAAELLQLAPEAPNLY